MIKKFAFALGVTSILSDAQSASQLTKNAFEEDNQPRGLRLSSPSKQTTKKRNIIEIIGSTTQQKESTNKFIPKLKETISIKGSLQHTILNFPQSKESKRALRKQRKALLAEVRALKKKARKESIEKKRKARLEKRKARLKTKRLNKIKAIQLKAKQKRAIKKRNISKRDLNKRVAIKAKTKRNHRSRSKRALIAQRNLVSALKKILLAETSKTSLRAQTRKTPLGIRHTSTPLPTIAKKMETHSAPPKLPKSKLGPVVTKPAKTTSPKSLAIPITIEHNLRNQTAPSFAKQLFQQPKSVRSTTHHRIERATSELLASMSTRTQPLKLVGAPTELVKDQPSSNARIIKNIEPLSRKEAQTISAIVQQTAISNPTKASTDIEFISLVSPQSMKKIAPEIKDNSLDVEQSQIELAVTISPTLSQAESIQKNEEKFDDNLAAQQTVNKAASLNPVTNAIEFAEQIVEEIQQIHHNVSQYFGAEEVHKKDKPQANAGLSQQELIEETSKIAQVASTEIDQSERDVDRQTQVKLVTDEEQKGDQHESVEQLNFEHDSQLELIADNDLKNDDNNTVQHDARGAEQPNPLADLLAVNGGDQEIRVEALDGDQHRDDEADEEIVDRNADQPNPVVDPLAVNGGDQEIRVEVLDGDQHRDDQPHEEIVDRNADQPDPVANLLAVNGGDQEIRVEALGEEHGDDRQDEEIVDRNADQPDPVVDPLAVNGGDQEIRVEALDGDQHRDDQPHEEIVDRNADQPDPVANLLAVNGGDQEIRVEALGEEHGDDRQDEEIVDRNADQPNPVVDPLAVNGGDQEIRVEVLDGDQHRDDQADEEIVDRDADQPDPVVDPLAVNGGDQEIRVEALDGDQHRDDQPHEEIVDRDADQPNPVVDPLAVNGGDQEIRVEVLDGDQHRDDQADEEIVDRDADQPDPVANLLAVNGGDQEIRIEALDGDQHRDDQPHEEIVDRDADQPDPVANLLAVNGGDQETRIEALGEEHGDDRQDDEIVDRDADQPNPVVDPLAVNGGNQEIRIEALGEEHGDDRQDDEIVDRDADQPNPVVDPLAVNGGNQEIRIEALDGEQHRDDQPHEEIVDRNADQPNPVVDPLAVNGGDQEIRVEVLDGDQHRDDQADEEIVDRDADQPNPVVDPLAVNGGDQEIRVEVLDGDQHRDDQADEEIVDRDADQPDPVANLLAVNGGDQEIRVEALDGDQHRDDQPHEEIVDRDADQPDPVANLLAVNGGDQETRIEALGEEHGDDRQDDEIVDRDADQPNPVVDPLAVNGGNQEIRIEALDGEQHRDDQPHEEIVDRNADQPDPVVDLLAVNGGNQEIRIEALDGDQHRDDQPHEEIVDRDADQPDPVANLLAVNGGDQETRIEALGEEHGDDRQDDEIVDRDADQPNPVVDPLAVNGGNQEIRIEALDGEQHRDDQPHEEIVDRNADQPDPVVDLLAVNGGNQEIRIEALDGEQHRDDQPHEEIVDRNADQPDPVVDLLAVNGGNQEIRIEALDGDQHRDDQPHEEIVDRDADQPDPVANLLAVNGGDQEIRVEALDGDQHRDDQPHEEIVDRNADQPNPVADPLAVNGGDQEIRVEVLDGDQHRDDQPHEEIVDRNADQPDPVVDPLAVNGGDQEIRVEALDGDQHRDDQPHEEIVDRNADQPDPVVDPLAVNGGDQEIRVEALDGDQHRDDQPHEEIVDRNADQPDPVVDPLAVNGGDQEIRVEALDGDQHRDDQPHEEIVDRNADQLNPVADILVANGDGQQIRVDALGEDHDDDHQDEEVNHGADQPNPLADILIANGDEQQIRVDALGEDHDDDHQDEELVNHGADQPNPLADILIANGDEQQIRVDALGEDHDDDHQDEELVNHGVEQPNPLADLLAVNGDGHEIGGGDDDALPVINLSAAEVPNKIVDRGVEVFEEEKEEDRGFLEYHEKTVIDWHQIMQRELPYGHFDDGDLDAGSHVKYIQDKEEDDGKDISFTAKDGLDLIDKVEQNEKLNEIELEVATLESDIDLLEQDSSSFKSYFLPIDDAGKLEHKRKWLAALLKGYEETQLSLTQLSIDAQEDGRDDLKPTIDTLSGALDEARVKITLLQSFFDSLMPLDKNQLEAQDIVKNPLLKKPGFETNASYPTTKGSSDGGGEEGLEEKLSSLEVDIAKLKSDINVLKKDSSSFKSYFSPIHDGNKLQHRREWLNHLVRGYNGFNELQQKLDKLSFKIQENQRDDLNTILETYRTALDKSQIKIASLKSFFDTLAPEPSAAPSSAGFSPLMRPYSLPSLAQATKPMASDDAELLSSKSKSGLRNERSVDSQLGPIDHTKTIYDEITIPTDLKPKLNTIPEQIRGMESTSGEFYYKLYGTHSYAALQEERELIANMIRNMDSIEQQLDSLDAELTSPEGTDENNINAQKHTIGVYRQLAFEVKRTLGEDLAKVEHVIAHRPTPEVALMSSHLPSTPEGSLAESPNVLPVSSVNIESPIDGDVGIDEQASKARTTSIDIQPDPLEDIRSTIEDLKPAIDQLKSITETINLAKATELDLVAHKRRIGDLREIIETNKQKLQTLTPLDSNTYNPEIISLRSGLTDLSLQLYDVEIASYKFLFSQKPSGDIQRDVMSISNPYIPAPLPGANLRELPSAIPDTPQEETEAPGANLGKIVDIDQQDPSSLHFQQSPSSLADLIKSLPESDDALTSIHDDYNQGDEDGTPPLSTSPVVDPHETEDTQSQQPTHTYEALLSSVKQLQTEVAFVKKTPHSMLASPKDFLPEIASRQSTINELQTKIEEFKQKLELLPQQQKIAFNESMRPAHLPTLLEDLEKSLERASVVLTALKQIAVPLRPLEPLNFPSIESPAPHLTAGYSPSPISIPGSFPPPPSGSKATSKKDKKGAPTMPFTTERKPLGALTHEQASNIGNRGTAPSTLPHPIKYASTPLTKPGELKDWVIVPTSSTPQPQLKVPSKPQQGIISGLFGTVEYYLGGGGDPK